ETDEYELNRGRTVILGGKNLRVIGLEGKLTLVPLLISESMETLHGRSGVGTVLPLAGCAPGELGGLRCIFQRFPCGEQRVDVDTVIDILLSHLAVSSMRRKVYGVPSHA